MTAGTLLAGTRLGLRSWFAAVWYVVNQANGVSALGLQRVLGFGSYETAWAWLHKLRRAMVLTSGKLTGSVEVDESYVGGVEQGVSGREHAPSAPSPSRSSAADRAEPPAAFASVASRTPAEKR